MNDRLNRAAADTSLPRWRAIADALERDIRDRRLPPGERLDAEPVLAERFSVNRHTVRQAVQHLAHAGLLRVERGRGTFVQGRAIAYPIGPRTRFGEIMLAQGLEAGHDIVGADIGKASAEEARHLRLRQGAQVARIDTRSLANGQVVTVAHNVFPASRLPAIIDHVQATRSISAALSKLGYPTYRRAWTNITAELPDAALAAQLDYPRTRPVLLTEALDVADDGTPLRLGMTAFAGDLCQIVVEGSAAR